MHPGRNHRRRETPTKRRNPSGDVRWVARYTNRDGQRKKAGTFKLKGPCRTPVDGYWSGSTWVGCCAQHAIDAAYERERNPRPVRSDTLGAYAEQWPSVHPRSKRTNDENLWRIGVVLAIELEGLELRRWPMSDVRRRHALAVQARLLAQGRSAEGATGILRAMSAMTMDAIDDEICESNPWLRLGVRLNDPRVKKAPRSKRLWTMEQMHAFAAAAAQVRDVDRDEPTELELWRAVYGQPMIRLLSDCGLRLGELPALERSDLRPGWLRVRQTAHESEVQPGTKTTHHKPQDEQWRDVPVPPSTETFLRAVPPRIDTPLLFPTPRGRIWRERNWRRDVWAPAQNAMGIDPRPQEFRASWESILAGAGVDRADLGKYAGHSVQTANARYVQPLDPVPGVPAPVRSPALVERQATFAVLMRARTRGLSVLRLRQAM